ncbi:hypothetical protein BI004_gp192 [Bacillus phage NotTheCreek]|uniref:hypothetical protein n=1 Tax=Bacillus phage NotTheCreek TaxID=1805952 RepID=UPI0007A774B2|nr:hypothetical protein BI004_gp192 [Bacillus phage NotTheCreek]AMW63411.1 hypothetical protein NOTTHECREEK_192 [Bacillus phage NotTheCreek]
MSEVKTGYFVDGGDDRLYRRLHCATEDTDFLEVGPTYDENNQFVFNIEQHINNEPEHGETPSINLTPETAKLLIKDLEAYLYDCQETDND